MRKPYRPRHQTSRSSRLNRSKLLRREWHRDCCVARRCDRIERDSYYNRLGYLMPVRPPPLRCKTLGRVAPVTPLSPLPPEAKPKSAAMHRICTERVDSSVIYDTVQDPEIE